MKHILAGGLASLLLWLGVAVRADEAQWRPAASSPRVLVKQAVAAQGAPAVRVGRAAPLVDAPNAPPPEQDLLLRRVAFSTVPAGPPRLIFRAQAPTPPNDLPPPPPPPDSGLPPSGPPASEEPFNCGAVTDNPPSAGNPIVEGGRRLINGITSPGGGRCLFQSDHCFDNFISPVTNPFLFEDPRSLTEVRPIFMYQQIPTKNWVTQGGNIEFFGVQGRLALTENWSIVLNKLGFVAIQPKDKTIVSSGSGFAEIDIGPKWTFLRNECCGTLGALGVTFQIPTGSGSVFQDTGSLSIVPYLSMGQSFWKTSYGSFNALGTVGYAFATDSERSEYLFLSLHLDYNIANANCFYPLIELNWFHYTVNGKVRPLDFEGRDLFNLGSEFVAADDDTVTLAVGFRYKFTECVQAGLAAEFAVTGRQDLLDWRVTADMIIRY
jgi:hypothetical protein